MRLALAGREGERATLEQALQEATERCAVVAITGDAGIGKTALLAEAAEVALDRGFRVLACRPVAAESTLAFAALGDLLAEVTDDDLATIPRPQREALEVALLRIAPSARPVDPRSVGTGLLSLLRAMASVQPVAVVVDDSPWIDRPTAAAVAFALRRLDVEPIAVLVASRTGDGGPLDPFGDDLGPRGAPVLLALGPLSLSAVYHAIRAGTGLVFPRPTLQRIMEASAGNPLFAIELARALAEHGGHPGPGQPLPVPDRLLVLLDDRIARLPDPWMPTLVAVTLLPEARTEVLLAALGPDAHDAIEGAASSAVLDVVDGRARFTHPLLAEVVLARASIGERRELHRHLAAVVAEPEQRARHLALAADGPDEEVAASLDAAAAAAGAQGAPDAAAELLALAVELTSPDDTDALAIRRLAQAEAALRSGATDDARTTVAHVLELAAVGPTRARALELDARVLHVTGTSVDAVARCDEALDHAGDDAALRARVHATCALVEYDDIGAAHAHARAALDLLATLPEPDPGVSVQAIMAFVEAETDLGRPLPMDLVEQGLALEERAPAVRVSDRLAAALGAWLKTEGRLDEARPWLERTLDAALEEGDESSLPYAYSHLPQLELWSGRWAEAETRALEHLDAAERTGQVGERRQALNNLALVRAHLGELDEAERLAMEDSDAWTDPWSVLTRSTVLGFIELSKGDHAAALVHLDRAAATADEIGMAGRHRRCVDHAEALISQGALGRADHVIAELHRYASTMDHATLVGASLRVRGLAAAARQDLDEAMRLLDAAVTEHDRRPEPFERARTLLARGQVRRRRGERSAAREDLAAAEATFAALPSPCWAARAADEAARVPTRRGRSNEATELTEAESRIADLVARGSSNQEVATALFVSPKTVEATLTRIYAKLGIRSRTQLAARARELEADAQT